VFAPYLIPPRKMVNYMIQADLQAAEDAQAVTKEAAETESAVAQQIVDDQPDELHPGR
jgi:hypothetical protein